MILACWLLNIGYFNPRSPWGERQVICMKWHNGKYISIHAPRGGSDSLWHGCQYGVSDFNPRSPWGERLARIGEQPVYNYISIHAPRGGSDLFAGRW